MNCRLILSTTQKYKLATVPSTYLELIEVVKGKLAHQIAYPFRLKYKDGEEELITLNCEEDLQTAVVTCKMENLKNLDIHVLRDEVNQSFISELGAHTSDFFINAPESYTINADEERNDQILQSDAEEQKSRANVSKIQSLAEVAVINAFQRGFAYPCNQFQKYSLPQTRKMSTDTNQTFEFEDILDRTNMFNTCASRQSMTSINRKSGSPTEKKPAYKVQFKSKFEYDTLQVKTGETFTYSFTMKNCGEEQWPENIKLICVNGVHKKQSKTVPSLKAGEKCEMGLLLTASRQTGKQLSQWRLHYDENGTSKGFGRTFFIETNVEKQQVEQKKETKKSFDLKPVPQLNRNCSIEAEDYRRVMKLGEALNDMFPGDLQGKMKFVESCPDHYSIYDLVDNYLLSLRGDTKFSNNNMIFA